MKNLSQQCFHSILSIMYKTPQECCCCLYTPTGIKTKHKKYIKCTSRFVFKTSKTVSLTWLLVRNLIFNIIMLMVKNGYAAAGTKKKKKKRNANQSNQGVNLIPFATSSYVCVWLEAIELQHACVGVLVNALTRALALLCACMFCEAITVPLVLIFFNHIRKSFHSFRFHPSLNSETKNYPYK